MMPPIMFCIYCFIICIILFIIHIMFLEVNLLRGIIYACWSNFKRCTLERKKINKLEKQTDIGTSNSVPEDHNKDMASNDEKNENSGENRILTLENDQFQETTLYKLGKGWTLEFRLGPSLFGRKVLVFTNYPITEQVFSRKTYYKLHWSNPSANDDSLTCTLKLNSSGSFHYYFIFNNDNKKQGSGYFVVDPDLEIFTLNCIQCVTVLSKNLGPFSNWENKLRVAKESGYNTIHFSPIQKLGGSNSAYSLTDQMTLNSSFSDEKYPQVTFNEVSKLTSKLKKEWKMLSICDIVLNHVANETLWLNEHPECTYNMINSPYLKPAYVLDITLHNFSLEIAKGIWEMNGIPALISNEDHLGALKYVLLEKILPEVKIEEFFTVPVESLTTSFLTKCRTLPPPTTNTEKYASSNGLKIIQDPKFRRLKSTVDMNLALEMYNVYRTDCFDEESRILKCASDFKTHLDHLNDSIRKNIENHLKAATNNVVSGVRYERIQHDGPKRQEITSEAPLFTRYFTDYKSELIEEHAETENGAFIMAHNGWVINADPLKNFADATSQVYFRRELIAWGDSVKLRYGSKPEDCPYLWQHMREYVESTVRAFDGVRLDNCHSTPIHVAEYLLDAARLIRPNLYVVAELFTNSDMTDNIFVNRLGITSLIRESMSAWDSHELGRLVYRFGGEPVGAFVKQFSRPLVPCIAHALFLDQTHDNPSPIEKRSVFDLLPSTALVSMACCATGSNMGYDQLVPHHIHVVEEKRIYMEWERDVNENYGIVAGKKALNDLHTYLEQNGFFQVFVDQIDSNIVCITRHNGTTHESVILISYTAFNYPLIYATGEGKGVTVTGCVENVIMEAYLEHGSGIRYSQDIKFCKNENIINGMTDYVLRMRKNFNINDATMVNTVKLTDNSTRVNFTHNFKPGSIVVIKFVQNENVQSALAKLSIKPDFREVKKSLTLAAINKILYCCNGEDNAVYQVPNFTAFTYCGLQGILSFLEPIAFNNDLGHPICHNLREGNWLIDYTIQRLKSKPETKIFGEKLEEFFSPIKDIPRYLIPSYFYTIISNIYFEIVQLAISLMSEYTIIKGSEFAKQLALGSVQFAGIIESSPLPLLSKNINPPAPSLSSDGKMPLCVSLSAGLPHFSIGYTRNWGRDTFIALRGLLLLTRRFEEARYIILAYSGCLRHGLIPNLLDGGRNARYNCRDAVWWWLYTIKNYITIVPNGENILSDKVNRLYPTDDSPETSVLCDTGFIKANSDYVPDVDIFMITNFLKNDLQYE